MYFDECKTKTELLTTAVNGYLTGDQAERLLKTIQVMIYKNDGSAWEDFKKARKRIIKN